MIMDIPFRSVPIILPQVNQKMLWITTMITLQAINALSFSSFLTEATNKTNKTIDIQVFFR